MTSPLDPLQGDEVRILAFSVAELRHSMEALRRLLSKDEKTKAERFRLREDGDRFAVCRGFLRWFLGQVGGADPRGLEFGYGDEGKPFLKDTKLGLFFNIAHSGEKAVFAVTRSGEIGVDVEAHRPSVDEAEIVERYFSEQDAQAWQRAGEHRTRLFFDLWTRHEALWKAFGNGILKRESLPRIVQVSENPPVWTCDYEGRPWWVRSLGLGKNLSTAVAAAGPRQESISLYQNDKNVLYCLNNIVSPDR